MLLDVFDDLVEWVFSLRRSAKYVVTHQDQVIASAREGNVESTFFFKEAD
jgi:hypothetical protein